MAGRSNQIQGEVRPILTEFAVGFRGPQNLIARQVAPVVPSLTESGTLFSFGKEGMMLYDTERALRANAKKLEFHIGKQTYQCAEHALEASLDYKELEQAERIGAQQVLRLEQRAVGTVSRALEIELEKAVADSIMNASNYATGNKATLTSTDQWTVSGGGEGSSSTPIDDIETGKVAARADMGIEPNVAVFGYTAWQAFKRHSTVLDLIKYSQRGHATPEIAAELLEVDRVVIGKAVYSTDGGVFTDLWGDHVALLYVPDNPELVEGTTPHTVIIEQVGYPMVMSYDMKKTRDFEVTRKYVVKNVDTSYGYLLSDTVNG